MTFQAYCKVFYPVKVRYSGSLYYLYKTWPMDRTLQKQAEMHVNRARAYGGNGTFSTTLHCICCVPRYLSREARLLFACFGLCVPATHGRFLRHEGVKVVRMCMSRAGSADSEGSSVV